MEPLPCKDVTDLTKLTIVIATTDLPYDGLADHVVCFDIDKEFTVDNAIAWTTKARQTLNSRSGNIWGPPYYLAVSSKDFEHHHIDELYGAGLYVYRAPQEYTNATTLEDRLKALTTAITQNSKRMAEEAAKIPSQSFVYRSPGERLTNEEKRKFLDRFYHK